MAKTKLTGTPVQHCTCSHKIGEQKAHLLGNIRALVVVGAGLLVGGGAHLLIGGAALGGVHCGALLYVHTHGARHSSSPHYLRNFLLNFVLQLS